MSETEQQKPKNNQYNNYLVKIQHIKFQFDTVFVSQRTIEKSPEI